MDMVESDKTSNYRKFFTLIGSMLLLMPGSVAWYWGGISVYALSYAVCRLSSGSEIQQTWIISLYYIFWTSSIIVNGFIAKFVPRQWIMLTGSIITNTAMFSSYFVIQNSLIVLEVMVGALVGVGDALIQGNAIRMVMKTADKDIGLLTSVLQSSHSIGALVITQLVTWYVNPLNESPNIKLWSTKYFSQKEVVDKVPSAFLVLGLFTFLCHVSGYILLNISPCLGFLKEIFPSSVKRTRINEKDGQIENYSDENTTKENDSSSPGTSPIIKDDTPRDYTPLAMLKTTTFYALWFTFFTADFPFILLANFYKLYGQLWISDDHFLSNLGTTFVFISSLSRIPWGIGLDAFGTRNGITLLLSSTIITVSWYYFTPLISRWLYFFVTLIYGSFGGALYSYYLAATAVLFGRKHVDTNYGILLSSSIAFNATAPFIIDVVLTKFGWFTTFALAGGLNIISLCLCLSFVP